MARSARKCFVSRGLGSGWSKNFMKKKSLVGPAVVRCMAEHRTLNVRLPTFNEGGNRSAEADPAEASSHIAIALSLLYIPPCCAIRALGAQRGHRELRLG